MGWLRSCEATGEEFPVAKRGEPRGSLKSGGRPPRSKAAKLDGLRVGIRSDYHHREYIKSDILITVVAASPAFSLRLRDCKQFMPTKSQHSR